jgi:hypothetical protein
MLNPDPLAALRLKLRRNGYFPVPCEGKGAAAQGLARGVQHQSRGNLAVVQVLAHGA